MEKTSEVRTHVDKMRWLTKLRNTVTVEPVLLLFSTGFALMIPTFSALIYRKVCLSHFNTQVCDNLHNTTLADEENVVQAESSYWLLFMSLCKGIPVFVMCFIYGSLSDNVSRKLAVCIPVAGQVLASTAYIIQSAYLELSVAFLAIGWLLGSTTGGWSTANMAAFSYMGDVTNENNRMFRIAVGEALTCIGIGIALLGGGALLDFAGFVPITSLTLAIYCFLLIYAMFWIKEPTKSGPGSRKRSCGTSCRLVCNLHSLKEAFGCIFKKRKQRRRMHILVSFVILMFTVIGSLVPLILIYLYVVKQPLSWSITTFGIYTSYALAVGVFGTVVLVPVMRNRLRMRETSILLCSLASSAGGMTLVSFAQHTWMVFAAPLVSVLGFSMNAVLRSLLAKMVEKNEYGRMFAMFGAVESLGGILANVLFTNVYSQTLHFWPGLSFALGAAILLIPMVLTAFLRYDLKKYNFEDLPSTRINSSEVDDTPVDEDSKSAILRISEKGPSLP